MIIDTSALLAIVFDEPDGPDLLRLVVGGVSHVLIVLKGSVQIHSGS